MATILRLLKKQAVGLGLTAASLGVVLFLHRIHAFDALELKAIDFAFVVRGPLSGWSARQEIPKDSLDVVIVDVDDETYRLVPWTWPYPHDVWALVVRNLARAGARVIVFDIQFDSPDRRSEYLKTIRRDLTEKGLSGLLPAPGDSAFANAIREAQGKGTSVILATKLVQEPTRMPPQYIQYPIPVLRASDPDYGLINEEPDGDGFSRQYFTFLTTEQEPDRWFPTLGLKAIQRFYNLPDETLPQLDSDRRILSYGPVDIPMISPNGRFLVNFYGPPSRINIGKNEAWKTFNRYPLSNVVDVMDVDLKEIDEDSDWMEFFMDESPMEGLLGESPFRDKIVLIGVSVEVFHDVKRTPFYTFAGQQQLMPGVEFHANAIQTLLDRNFISVYGTDYGWSEKSRFPHIVLISGLALLAYAFVSFMNPLLAGISILVELLVFVSVAIGAFTTDSLWLVKLVMGNWAEIAVPGYGESFIVPVVSPVFAVFVTYTSNVLYRFIVEQKDKRFLKNTFGTYVSPELIDQMYDTKQEPKLGGDAGYHTAFFSDIQSFSSFSEVLEPQRMVALMNEYLTEMTDILLKHRGTLDKYIGDAIVAFYGAPVPVEDHEYQACKTALEMEERLKELRLKWMSEDEWPDLVHDLRHRVGLSSGEMVTGNMGSNMRMNYTMMGDTVNIASRLEASGKQYGVYIQVAESTYKVVEDRFEWRFLDNVRVKGKKRPVKVYELLTDSGQLDETHSKLLPTFHEGMELYQNQEWDRALEAFEEAESLEDMFPKRPTNPSRVYIERCKFFKENPPGDDWDGVWVLTKK